MERISRNEPFVSASWKNNFTYPRLLRVRVGPISRPNMLVHEHLDLIPDEVLLCNIGQGCSDCFALLFRRYCRRVYSVALRILRDRSETEDILQEVFLAIYLQQEQFDPQKGSVRSWILQFAYFKALLRRRYLSVRHFYKREELSEVNEVRRIDPSELLGMSDAERTHYVETAVATLSNKQ